MELTDIVGYSGHVEAELTL